MVEAALTCNKCRSGARQQGDSWCLACAALESLSADLRREWSSAALRVIAEDACVAALARSGRCGSLPSRRSSELGTAAKVKGKRTRSPPAPPRPRPKTPPRPPPGHRERAHHERPDERSRPEEEHSERRKKHRGGTKHQQHTRRRDDGEARVTHRPLGREHFERQALPREEEER